MKKILLVEDDETIAFGIQQYLGRHGFTIDTAGTLAQGQALFSRHADYALALLDWNLPDGTGDTLCRWLKQQRDIPIIFLTIRDDDRDVVRGLDMGADDYIVKPFQLAVLLSRVNAVLRRAPAGDADILCCGDVRLEPAKTKVWMGRQTPVALTAGEYRLLLLLLQNKNQTLTRRVLLERLWDADGDFVNDNTLTVTMKRLREKLNGAPFIKTIRGIGYRAEEDDG